MTAGIWSAYLGNLNVKGQSCKAEKKVVIVISAHNCRKGKIFYIPSYADVQNASLCSHIPMSSCSLAYLGPP